MRELLRKHLRFFLLTTLTGVALRLAFIFRFPGVSTDSFVYGDIAKNWLQHGLYGLSGINEISPTYIRLPGYPAFLAAIFAIFGMEHYRAVLVVQMFVDIGTCFLIADLARRLISLRAARVAFLLAALCPFLANYVANALTETLEVFFTVLALDLAIVGLDTESSMKPWVGCGLAMGAAILLRPDGGLLLLAVEAYLSRAFGSELDAQNADRSVRATRSSRRIDTGSRLARDPCSLDGAQSACIPRIPAARAALCQRRKFFRAARDSIAG